MSNRSKGARLYLRAASGKEKAVWLIRDGDKSVRTGCGAQQRREAEQRLADYIAAKYQPTRTRDRHPSQVQIDDVLNIYIEDVAILKARPKEVGQRVKALLAYFGGKTLDKVNGSLCRSYVKHRGSSSMARRELEDLRAAINHHRKEGLCSEIVSVVLPEKPRARERWLTRSEAARLLWGAWRGGQGKRKHVARFILVGLYTGTRAGAICGAAIRPTVGRGYVDLEAGVFYRRASGAKETKKRQPPVRLPPRLLAHLRRWERCRKSKTAVVEFKGKAIERMAKAFRNTAIDAKLADVSPHILRHTAITWAMQGGADPWQVCGYFGITMDMLTRVYGHHHPDHGAGIHRAQVAHRLGGTNVDSWGVTNAKNAGK
jgi:integrase